MKPELVSRALERIGAWLAIGVLTTSWIACSTYSASITVEPNEATVGRGNSAPRAEAVVAQVARSFEMESSPLDLEAMQRAATGEQDEYRPIAVYRNTIRSPVKDRGRILLVLERHLDGDGLRLIIRDLERA
ncbi:MAG TPA: hypothetical protein VMW19_13520 [Myxococcota bacterium]|nr:hypothetical protein [Myxococcota bacterium]